MSKKRNSSRSAESGSGTAEMVELGGRWIKNLSKLSDLKFLLLYRFHRFQDELLCHVDVSVNSLVCGEQLLL